MVYIPAVFTIWLVIPAFLTMMAFLSTDVINGICVPWGAFSSIAMEKTVLFNVVFVNYLLPLALMIFCYSRIVYSLHSKVNNT